MSVEEGEVYSCSASKGASSDRIDILFAERRTEWSTQDVEDIEIIGGKAVITAGPEKPRCCWGTNGTKTSHGTVLVRRRVDGPGIEIFSSVDIEDPIEPVSTPLSLAERDTV